MLHVKEKKRTEERKKIILYVETQLKIKSLIDNEESENTGVLPVLKGRKIQ